MSPSTNSAPFEILGDELTALRAEILRLKDENERLQTRAQHVADANVYAVEAMVELERAHSALREKESYLHDLLDQLPAGILVLDPKTHTILDANPYALGIIGRPRQEVIGRVCHGVICPAEAGRCPITDLGQTVDHSERIILGPDRDKRAVLKTVRTTVRNGCPVLLESFVDIRTQREAEVQMRRAKMAAEIASRVKSEFLANMSHEIRTPMNGIIGMTDLVLATELSTEQRDYLFTVKESAGNLLTIIDDILDFSKIEAGKLELDSVALDLPQEIGRIGKLLRVRAEQKELEFVCRVDPAVPARLIGDPVRLGQILVNLAGNAIKFTEKGSVSIEVTLDSSSQAEDNAAFLRFEVRDTGIGIPPAQQANIFEAFKQADGSIARRFGGTGLGLTISRRLVAMMGGTIGFESCPGIGTTFHFTVPIRIASETGPQSYPTNAEAQSEDPRECRPLCILVAEDNKINQRVIGCQLGKSGHTVTLAGNGRDVLDALSRQSFDLILMDLQMSDIDGFEATRTIREREKSSGEHIPIVALTAHAMKGDREKCLSQGMDGYLSKPVDAKELHAVLRMLANGAPR